MYGDAAVVTGRYQVKLKFKGRENDDSVRITELFAKQGGKWRCVSDAGDIHRRATPGEALTLAHSVGRPRADSEVAGGGRWRSPVRPYPEGTV